MNVGLTRAKSSLWVLGNSESLVRGKFWKQLVEDAQSRDRYTTGNVLGMLKKHSREFPVPGQPPMASHNTPQIKQEPGISYTEPSVRPSKELERRQSSSSTESRNINCGKPTNALIGHHNGKRKLEATYDSDVEMLDADALSRRSSSLSNTAGSTPAAVSTEKYNSPATAIKTEVKTEIKAEAIKADATPTVSDAPPPKRPKVIKRRPKEPNVFITRPKKKTG